MEYQAKHCIRYIYYNIYNTINVGIKKDITRLQQ